jgi:hypothetical protein
MVVLDGKWPVPMCLTCYQERFGPVRPDLVHRFVTPNSGAWMPCPECGEVEGVYVPDHLGFAGTSVCRRCGAQVAVGPAPG